MKTPFSFHRCALAFLAALSAAGTAKLHAQTALTWGPNGSGTPVGGPATWDLSSNFWTPDGGVTYQAWPSSGANSIAVFATPDPATFSGSTTDVTLSGNITTAGLRFNTLSYNLIVSGAGNTLTLATNTAFAPRIDVAYPASTNVSTATISGPLAGTSGLNVGGYGTLTLTGNNTLTGGININGATLDISAGPGALVSSNTLTMGGAVTDGGNNGGGGTFIYDNINARSASSSQTLSAIQVSSGDNTVEANWNGVQTIALTFGSQSRAANATVNYYINLATVGVNGTDGKINLTSQATGFIDTGTFVNGTVNFTPTSDYAWKDSSGFLRPITYGTDPGTATTAGGTSITPGANSYFQMTGNVTAQTTATLKTLRISGNKTLALTSGATLTLSGLLKVGGNATTISGGTGLQAALNDTMIVRTDASNDVININTPILANGTNAFVKSGPGSVVFGAANTYTGATYINGGELRLTNAAALPSGSNVQFSGGVLDLGANAPTAFTLGTGAGQLQWTGDGGFAAITNNATVTLNGGAGLTWGSGNFVPNGNRLLFASQQSNKTLTLANDIDLGSAMRTVNVGGFSSTTASVVLAGKLTGTGGITITGGGTITITNPNNSYSGGTNLVNGTLLITADNALGTGPIIVGGSDASAVIMGNTARTISNNFVFLPGSGAAYQLAGAASAPLTFTGAFSGSGTFSTTGSNTVTFAGNSPNFTGVAELQNTTVTIASNSAFGTGTVQFEPGTIQGDGTPRTIPNDGTFLPMTIGGSSDLTFSGHLKNDYVANPTITINNTGVTTFGAIDLADAGTAHTVTFLVNNTSVAFITGTIVSGFNTTTSALTKSGTGTLTISSTANTYGGATTISGGGVLAVTSLANGGVASSIGQSSTTGTNLIINGSTLSYIGSGSTTNRLFQVGASGAGSSGTLDASGTGAVNFNATGALVYGTTNQTRTLVLTGTSTAANTLAPAINNNGSGAVSLTKNGTGTWVISNGGTFSGATTINAGLLVMNGIASSSAVTVNSGGTLGGSGSVGNVTVNNGGAVAPGNSPGTLNTKNFSLLSGGALKLEIGGVNAGQFDQVNVTGTVSLAGNVQISLFGGYTPNLGDKFFVVLNDSTDLVTGTFANTDASNDVTVGNTVFAVNYTDNSSGGGSGNDVSLTVINIVPEPASTGLFLLGLAGLVARRRRQSA